MMRFRPQQKLHAHCAQPSAWQDGYRQPELESPPSPLSPGDESADEPSVGSELSAAARVSAA